jgi:Arylsulfatase regulator (Fe-S oxidoreductase)
MFIKLFMTPNHYYCLDANMSEIFEIGYESYQYLEQILDGQGDKKEIVNEAIPEEILTLQGEGYLSEKSNVKTVKHPYTDYLEEFLDRKLSKITLQVTQDCNFRCKYCIYSEDNHLLQRSHSSKSMNWETAKNAVDFLWKHSVDCNVINIAFYGGEPLLQMSLVKRVIEYSEGLFEGKKLTFNITTNGTLLDKEKILYLQKHNVSLTISLDGPKEINDKNRVFENGTGTYDSVMRKIALVREVAPDYAEKLSISMVMDPENDFDCINEICLKEEDFEKVSILASIVEKNDDVESAEFSNDYVWKYEYQRFLAILSHIGRYEREKVSPIISSSVNTEIEKHFEIEFMSRLYENDAPSGPCIPGQLRLFCNVDGQFLPCERVNEQSSTMCIGSLETGFDINKALKLLNVGDITSSTCKNCWCFRYCTLCCKKADSGKDTLDPAKKLSFCVESKNNAYHRIMMYLLLKECKTDYLQQIRNIEQKGDI